MCSSNGLAGRRRIDRRLVEVLAANSNDLEAPAMRIQPVIGEVLAALKRHQWGLAGADVRARARPALRFLRTPRRRSARHRRSLDHPQWWVHAGVLS